jgi:hypothetical protein
VIHVRLSDGDHVSDDYCDVMNHDVTFCVRHVSDDYYTHDVYDFQDDVHDSCPRDEMIYLYFNQMYYVYLLLHVHNL